VAAAAGSQSSFSSQGSYIEIAAQKLAGGCGQEPAWLNQLRNSAGVEYAELNYVVTIK